MYQSVPNELKMFAQWVVWRYEETESPKPTKMPYSPRSGTLASSTDSSTWSTFEEAVACASASTWYAGIGFVLTDADPFTFIDLDDPYELNPDGSYKHQDPDRVLQGQLKIYNEFESYAERSPSGKGLHIIVRGAIPSGRRRSSVEIYSTQRYMTVTGDAYRQAPIKDYHELANVLWEQIGQGKNAATFYAGLDHARHTDDEVLSMAENAANGEKFVELFHNGNWQRYYPSQSEADLALVDIIAFYSENRQQVQNIFLKSALAQRIKSRAQYRINYMLNKCFDRMLPPIDVDGLRNQLNEALEARVRQAATIEPQSTAQQTHTVDEPMPDASQSVYTVPPGLAGELAQFIYAQAPRQVPEIALAGALSLLAGIVGRAYNISGTGLNQYILLIAGTGRGKEAMARGIAHIMGRVVQTVPAASEFVGPGEIASPQALIKYMSNTAKSFVTVIGEFGIALQQMAAFNAAPNLVGLRRTLLDFYNKSGNRDVLRPSIYSDKDKNTMTVNSPALTLLGESTPEKFYEGIHEGMITEGLIPRFTIIEYRGPRPPLNEDHLQVVPSHALVEKMASICSHALMLNSSNKVIDVALDSSAQSLFDQFETFTTGEINKPDANVVSVELWNRSHFKALRLAGLLAVGNNPYSPIVTFDVANWAINLVVADCHNMLARFKSGDIGVNNEESSQLTKVLDVIKEYVTSPWSAIEKYNTGTSVLHGARIVPYSFLHKRVAQLAVFRKDRMGNSGALKRALKTLAERGDIQEVGKPTLIKEYNCNALCFMVTNLRVFGLQP